jgi:hypothetical protein
LYPIKLCTSLGNRFLQLLFAMCVLQPCIRPPVRPASKWRVSCVPPPPCQRSPRTQQPPETVLPAPQLVSHPPNTRNPLVWLNSVLRIRDPDPTFSIPDPNCLYPGSRIRIKEFKYFIYFNPKKWFLSSRKYDPGCSSRIPDPDANFLPIPDPGVKKAPDPGSGSATLVKFLDTGTVRYPNLHMIFRIPVPSIDYSVDLVWCHQINTKILIA